jgi:hypothetical protein
MAIKRYTANADNSITNAFKEDLQTRGTGSNAGAADVLETFSIYAQQSTSSVELSRILVQFPISDISSDRTAGIIPASGSVNFFLNLYNAPHSTTLPKDFKLTINAVSGSWQEGNGLDLDNYTDLTYDKIGSNWIKREGSTSWATAGGDIYTDSSSSFEQSFPIGTEDLSVDITTLVEQWIDSGGNVLGSKDNNGVLVKLSSSYEATSSTNLGGAVVSYYTKKFFARGSEFFFDRPTLEARWDSTLKDQRGQFFYSSSLAPAADNLNTIFLYNYVRGRLRDIPSIGTDSIYVSIFSGSAADTAPSGSALKLSADGTHVGTNNQYVATGSHVSTGIYKCSFAFTGSSTLETIYDVWFSGSNTIGDASAATIQFHTGTIEPETLEASNINPNGKYVISMPYMKESYSSNETERFRLYVRDKNWCPNIYTKVQATVPTLIIESASYQVTRTIDQRIVIPYGTGSNDNNYSMLSYDVSGNYFDLDLSMLEAGYTYAFQYSFYEDSVSSYREQPYLFKFRVEKDEY